MEDKPIFLIYEQVAERWQCSKSTAVRRLTSAGFPVVRFNDGSSPLIRLADLEAFEEGRIENLRYGAFPNRKKKKAKSQHEKIMA
jgi:hypothetical protein